MNFKLSEDLISIKEMAKSFSESELMPYASEWDQNEIYPLETLKKSAKLGLAGIYVDEKFGGSGLNRLAAALVFEELSRGCVSTSAFLSIHNMVVSMIDSHGSNNLKRKFIPRLCSMDLVSSYCLTEPDSGSDAAALKTTAIRKNNSHYILNGSKSFISGGPTSDLYAVMCRTGESKSNSISCILVEKNTEGLSFGKREKKMGWNSQHTSTVNFEKKSIHEVSKVINDDVIIVIMLESPKAIENVEEIASVSGVDVLLIGTNDLCMEMGIPGQYDHEDIKSSFEKVIQACNKNNIIPGMGGVYTEELMYEYINLGMRFILCGSDLSFLMTAAKNRSDNLFNFYKKQR